MGGNLKRQRTGRGKADNKVSEKIVLPGIESWSREMMNDEAEYLRIDCGSPFLPR